MSQQNLIAINIPQADLLEIKAAIATLSQKLGPYLQTLSNDERQEMAKMGDKTVAFVQKSHEYSQKNPALVPAYLDMAGFELDMRCVQTLRDISQELSPLVVAIEDSTTLAGSDAYQAALMFYTSVKNAAKSNVGNSIAIYNDLSNRFPGAAGHKRSSTAIKN